MASVGNEIERWTPRQGGRSGELAEPVIPPENDHHLSPVKSMGSTDHALHLPGRADSAYSSFSGGSHVPECPTRPCCGECCPLPPEQAPYMDSEYVRGIYTLSAAPPDLRSLQPHKAPAPSIHPSSPSLPDRCGTAPTRGTLNQGPAALAAPPPSPPTRLDSYNITRHRDSSRGGHSECKGQAAPAVQDSQLAHRDVPGSQHWHELTERDIRPAREKTLENKGLSSGSTNEASLSNIQGLKTGGNGEWSPPQQPAKRSNPHICSRPSSFIFQEYLRTDSVANVPKILSAYNSVHGYKIPTEMNSQSYHPAHSNPSAVNDTQEVKQCPCGVQKPTAKAALPSTVPGPSQGKGPLPRAQDLLCAQWHPDMDQDVFEDSCDTQCVENALPAKNASRKLNSCTDNNRCYDSAGKPGRGVREPVLDQQGRVQRSLGCCSCEAVGAEHPQHEGLDQGRKQCCDTSSQMAFFRPKEDPTSRLVRESQEGKRDNNSNPNLSTCLEQGDPPVQKHQPGFQTQLSRQLWEDGAGEQISRQMTPMLYYLSGGEPSSVPQPTQLPHSQEDSRSPREIPSSGCAGSAQGVEKPRESPQCPGPSQHPRGRAELHSPHPILDPILGGPASFTEESFQNDYREKLKVAQKKVLRETSFKRKDLQMSLPVRLRQKPSKRPSIEHLRSLSLSSANEDAKPVLCSPSHLESLESFSKDEGIQKPQTSRVGARKRVTKEEKKLCYSEPEKLDQLMDKEASWSQVRDEITEQDIVAARRRALENGERALSSSSISRTELKQIQHTALMEYMERKISQRPGGSQHLPLHQPPLHKRLSHPKGPPGKISNPSGSRKMQNDEVFHQVFPREKSPDVFPASAVAAPPGVSSRGDPSGADPSTAHGTCPSTCPAAERLPQAGDPALGRAPDRSKSAPPSPRDTCRCASGAAAPSQSCEGCASSPSFRDPEKDGSKNHGHNGITGHACFQDTKELTPETSAPIPRRGSEEGGGVEEECRTQCPSGNAALKHPGQHPAAPAEQGMCPPPALAQPLQGDRNAPKGSAAQEDVPLGTGTRLPRRRLQDPHHQRDQELALEIVARDRSLVDILMPHPGRKTALDLMEGLFPVNISMLDKSHRKKGNVQHVQEKEKSHGDGPEECPESEHEAERRSKESTSERHQVLPRSRDSTNDPDDITSKKLELMASLRARLQSLWEEQELVLQESRECARRGQGLQDTVRDLCKPNEFERYLMFIGDLEKVVSLLLCLSSRLARVQNAMSRMDGSTDPEERHSLSQRHKLLSRQREDAKDLKENLERRERVVSGILAKYLTEQQLQDYRHFVQAKTSLLIEQKDLEEQIKFFEEQLETLEQSLPL
ncbi:protein Shroom1 isoform X2 [Neopelma chrysocephalum]|uniref:protein Shroom1 isoform X2 n=1 Tax=Neopelma chrysocephalum TaxID=114329 RepID=UPI000FCD0A20|nr:protein Shroom1 isoform X2 [Neopelma chrysocephalum]